MRMGTRTVAVCAAVCVSAAGAAAQGRTMTLSEALARAREQSPRIVSARLAVDEARARLSGASIRFQTNPLLDAAVGVRDGSGTDFTDFELGVGQTFETGARRSARIAGAEAAVAVSAATVEAVTRTVLRQTAAAYYRAVHASDRIRLLNAAHELASGVYSAADRRFKAGDIAVLDVNLARASLARVRAEREGAEASRALALGELRQLLRLDGDLAVDGSLPGPRPADLNAVLQAASDRPELRALEAGIQEAEAELQLGQTFSQPDYGVGVRYSREGGDQVVLGGITVALPLYSKGQEQRAAGSARAARLRAELDLARARVQAEVRTAFDAHARRLAAVQVLETEAVVGLDENEQLTTRSFEVGHLGLPDLLLIRREILETRFQYVDALLEAVLARTDLDAIAGMLR
jgi:cobalt-zinc-cadmium efflux system outer membrane protein